MRRRRRRDGRPAVQRRMPGRGVRVRGRGGEGRGAAAASHDAAERLPPRAVPVQQRRAVRRGPQHERHRLQHEAAARHGVDGGATAVRRLLRLRHVQTGRGAVRLQGRPDRPKGRGGAGRAAAQRHQAECRRRQEQADGHLSVSQPARQVQLQRQVPANVQLVRKHEDPGLRPDVVAQ